MRRTKDEWTNIVESYQTSSLTVRHFCQSAGVAEQSLRNWIKRVSATSGSKADTVQGFVEVRPGSAITLRDASDEPILDPSLRSRGLTIRFIDGTVIAVHPDTDKPTLQWVLALMGNRQ